MIKFLYTLFYPWLRAVSDLGYIEYQMSDYYPSSNLNIDPVKKFLNNPSIQEECVKLAFRKNWLKILFCPFLVLPAKELYEYRESDSE